MYLGTTAWRLNRYFPSQFLGFPVQLVDHPRPDTLKNHQKHRWVHQLDCAAPTSRFDGALL